MSTLVGSISTLEKGGEGIGEIVDGIMTLDKFSNEPEVSNSGSSYT